MKITLTIPRFLVNLYNIIFHNHTSWRGWKQWWRFHDYLHIARLGVDDVTAYKRARVGHGFWYWLKGDYNG
jgi:hypothetical protein